MHRNLSRNSAERVLRVWNHNMVSIDWLKTAMEHINDGVVIAEYRGETNPVVYVNPAFEQISGYAEADLLGQDCRLLKGSDGKQGALQTIKQAILEGRECTAKVRQYTKEGRLFWNEVKIAYIKDDANITHLISINRDATQEEYVKSVLEKVNVLYGEMSRRLEYTNETDSLTQLKNRGHLSTRGEFMLGAAKRKKLRLHGVVVDIDNFKLLNSAGGSGLGDECLLQVAQIIRYYFSRATDIAIRMCDDEFVIICIEDDDSRVMGRAEALRDDVQRIKMHGLDGNIHEVSVSIGIYSITPEKHTTIEDIIQNAGQLVFQGSHGMRNHIAHQKGNDCNYPRRQ